MGQAVRTEIFETMLGVCSTDVRKHRTRATHPQRGIASFEGLSQTLPTLKLTMYTRLRMAYLVHE